MDTEEFFDLVFYRPLGFAWAMLAAKLGITPNVITIASIFLGVGAGICFYFDNIYINLIGAGLLIWANSFDSADGQLARMTKQYSETGRILDGVCGDLWFITIYAAICLREDMTSDFFMEHKLSIWIIAAIAGACHGLQAAMADYYRQFHLYFVKGADGSELQTSENIKREIAELNWKKNPVKKLFMTFYCGYTMLQEYITPNMQRLRAKLRNENESAIQQVFQEKFRTLSKPLMKYTNILTFNTRCFALFAAILIFKMPWLYFAFELTVMNALLIYMVWRHERMCKSLISQL